jgi:proteasome accessory factor C
MRVADPALVRRLMLQLGGAARVVQPADLAARIASDAAALAHYEAPVNHVD